MQDVLRLTVSAFLTSLLLILLFQFVTKKDIHPMVTGVLSIPKVSGIWSLVKEMRTRLRCWNYKDGLLSNRTDLVLMFIAPLKGVSKNRSNTYSEHTYKILTS